MKIVIPILTVIAMAFGAYFSLEGKFALSKDVSKDLAQVQQTIGQTQKALERFERRVDQKFVLDEIKAKRDEIREIERTCGANPRDRIIRERLQQLQEEKRLLEEELKVMRAR